MVEQVIFQTVFQFLQTLGILVGVFYYIMVLRNQSKTRQIQLIMQLSDSYTEEFSRKGVELLDMEWKDYDEFERKYGSDNNPDNFAMRVTSWNRFNTQGQLLMNRLIDADTIFGANRQAAMFHWKKFGEVIKEIRRRYNMPLFCTGFEYLANENSKYLERRGFSVEVPETYYQYIPDEK
jgi:hypothetical protein